MEERMKIGVENVASACRGCLCDCRNGTCFDIHSFLIAPNCSISQILAKFVSIPVRLRLVTYLGRLAFVYLSDI